MYSNSFLLRKRKFIYDFFIFFPLIYTNHLISFLGIKNILFVLNNNRSVSKIPNRHFIFNSRMIPVIRFQGSYCLAYFHRTTFFHLNIVYTATSHHKKHCKNNYKYIFSHVLLLLSQKSIKTFTGSFITF